MAGADGGRVQKLYLRAKGITRQQPQQRPLRTVKHDGVRRSMPGPGGMTGLKFATALGFAAQNLIDHIGAATNAAGKAAIGVVDRAAVQLHQPPADADQQRMASGDIIAVKAVGQADRGVHLSTCGQSQPIGDGGNGANARRGIAGVVGQGIVAGLLVLGQNRRGAKGSG